MPEYPTPEAAANELIETFDFLEDWEQRYELLNDLGEKARAACRRN